MATLEIKDLTPRFLDFYTSAQAEQADPDRRWEIFREKYNFAAVPPTPEGWRIARELLDRAWERYPQYMDRIQQGAAGMQPDPQPIFESVARLLEWDGNGRVVVVVFVGMLDGNAFAAPNGDMSMVYLPVEQDPEERALVVPHELIHAVHRFTAHLTTIWERPVAQVVLEEGLSTRGTAELVPGRPPEAYLEYSPGWLEKCRGRAAEILRGIRPHLEESSSDAVYRFTMGPGSTGLEREAYYAGWLVVGHLLSQGHRFGQIARVPTEAMPALVDQAIDELLAGR